HNTLSGIHPGEDRTNPLRAKGFLTGLPNVAGSDIVDFQHLVTYVLQLDILKTNTYQHHSYLMEQYTLLL
ncbi:MAG: hypothetical protein KJ729_00980, partial [Euryarchaeota archaeon]|nr:hypothetical protein [Euryarchaeota archaeon]